MMSELTFVKIFTLALATSKWPRAARLSSLSRIFLLRSLVLIFVIRLKLIELLLLSWEAWGVLSFLLGVVKDLVVVDIVSSRILSIKLSDFIGDSAAIAHNLCWLLLVLFLDLSILILKLGWKASPFGVMLFDSLDLSKPLVWIQSIVGSEGDSLGRNLNWLLNWGPLPKKLALDVVHHDENFERF